MGIGDEENHFPELSAIAEPLYNMEPTIYVALVRGASIFRWCHRHITLGFFLVLFINRVLLLDLLLNLLVGTRVRVLGITNNLFV
jgi:hypothetical protein